MHTTHDLIGFDSDPLFVNMFQATK